MSHPNVVYWPPVFSAVAASANTAKIAPVQSMTVNQFATYGGNLTLNSNPTLEQNPNGPYIYDGVIRTVSLTATGNPAVTFTVNGIGVAVDGSGNPTGNLGPISEAGLAPNAGTVYTAHIFKTITSIVASSQMAGGTTISAGFGSSGIAGYVFMDTNRASWYASVQGAVVNRATLTYSVYGSLTKPETPSTVGNILVYPYGEIPAFSDMLTNPIAQASTNQLGQINFPVALVWATIANNTTNDEAFVFTVLQQGLRS